MKRKIVVHLDADKHHSNALVAAAVEAMLNEEIGKSSSKSRSEFSKVQKISCEYEV